MMATLNIPEPKRCNANLDQTTQHNNIITSVVPMIDYSQSSEPWFQQMTKRLIMMLNYRLLVQNMYKQLYFASTKITNNYN